MSIFGSLDIGERGLAASQLALNVTGQNISNANTEGYSRKRIELSSATRADAHFGEMGFGVEIEKIVRYADKFLELQIRGQLTEQGFYEVIDESLERVENILTEPTDSGLNEAMDKFWNAWQDLANNPEDVASRELVKSTSLVLIDKFHTLAAQLEDLRVSQNTDIENHVDEINGLTKEIFALNEEVAVAELRGGEANDSRDRRDVLIQELAKIVDVNVVEDELGRVTVTTAGSVVVGPSRVVELELARSTGLNALGQPTSDVAIRFANTKKDYVPRGGALLGLYEVRDELIPKYQGVLDEIAATFVTKVNELHFTGYNMNRNTGVSFFDETKLEAWTLDLSAAIKKDALNISAASGGTSVPVSSLAAAVPPAATTQTLDLKTLDPNYQNIVLDSLQITVTGPPSIVLQEGAGKDYVVDYERGLITFTDYGNKYVDNTPIDIDFRYNSSGFSGPGDGSNALKIAQLRDQLLMGDDGIGNPTKAIGEFYSAFIGVLGVERSQAISTIETREFMVGQFKSRKESISGVSLDEELANMIKFEHTYQASARYISVINTIMDTLLNL